MSQSQLPPARLVITGTSPTGKSIILSDEHIPPFHPFGPKHTSFSNFHSSPSVPVSNITLSPNLSSGIPRCPPQGISFGISDFPPGAKAPMHRTLSLDYAVVVEGEIVLGLDGGEERVVGRGEFIVQRGVNHSWENRGDTMCRIMFVMTGAEKIVLEDGTVLEEVHPTLPTQKKETLSHPEH